jgi:hypothetical protein
MRIIYAEYRRIPLMHIQHQQVNIEAHKRIYLVPSAFWIPQESGYQELVRYCQYKDIPVWKVTVGRSEDPPPQRSRKLSLKDIRPP